MANQTIPITQTWGPVVADVSALNINQLGELIAQQLAGSIRADVSFYLETLIDPTTFITSLIFNSTQRVFKGWDPTAGAYVPITQYAIGDVKNSFVGTDSLVTGWVVLDGRLITAIPGITTAQQTVLETFFGVGGNLPIVAPQNISGMPTNGAFSGITVPTILPANGVIGALPIGAAYNQGEVQGLRDNTETLRDTTADVEAQVAAIQTKAEELLVALNNNTNPPLYALLFVGFQ